jgi:predicted transcriptional regulator
MVENNTNKTLDQFKCKKLSYKETKTQNTDCYLIIGLRSTFKLKTNKKDVKKEQI